MSDRPTPETDELRITLSGFIGPSNVDWEYLAKTPDDITCGEAIAYHIGDTFIDASMPPIDQWARLVMMLRAHGVQFEITLDKEAAK